MKIRSADQEIMSDLLDYLKTAPNTTEVPVAAAIFDQQQKQVAIAQNLREQTLDPIAHAEIIALRNINLEIKKGQLIALIGNSGSGKTTLLQIAGLLDGADSGQIFINNIDASNSSDKTRTEIRKKNIGFIYQFEIHYNYNIMNYSNNTGYYYSKRY
jgi:predicted ABC-type transport system involved in lysophospholipase L1 biosynthesis ATPase subunit